MAIEIVDFPINSMVIFHSYVNVYQRVNEQPHLGWLASNSSLTLLTDSLTCHVPRRRKVWKAPVPDHIQSPEKSQSKEIQRGYGYIYICIYIVNLII